MADVNSNININFNTAAALAQLRQLQAGLSRFHQSLAEGNLAAANAQKGLNAQLLQSIGATGKFSASQVKVAGSTLAFTSALEKNKFSLREYYRYTMAAATANTRVMSRAFTQEREIINRARRDRVKALQSQYIQMNKANSGFMDAIRIMPKSLQMASGRFTELGTRIQYAAQRQQFLNQLLKQGSTQLLNYGKNTQWAGRQLMVGLTMPLALLGGMAAKSFRELEKETVRFRRVYGDAFTNDAETDAAVENIRRLGNEYVKYGQSVTKTMEMAATAAAAGFEGADLNAQVATATKLAILGEVEQQDALKTTISLQSAFGISSQDLAQKIDFLNAVENQTLLSIEDLTIAIPKAAPVVKQLGGNVEDLAFFLTAMKEGGINASEGANALKSGLASLINPAEKSAKMLAELGINVNSIVESNAGDIKGTVIEFANALDTLDPLNRARAIEQMFGKFQFSRLSTLFQNVVKDGSQASRALDLAGSSMEELAILSEREMKKLEDAVGVKFQAALEKFKKDIMPLGKAFLEALTPVVQFFGSLFEKFNNLSDKTKKVVAVIVATVAGLGPLVLMTFGLLMNGVANVIKLFAMLRAGMAKLNGQTNIMGAGFTYMTQEQLENAASSQQLHQTHTRLVEVFNVERTSVNALASSYNSLSTQMRAMAVANPALFAGGMRGATSAVKKLPPVKKYQDGILSVPGPKGAGDVVPAMLAPGEAVIPTKTTDKYRGLISAMFQDKVPGFRAGRIPGGPARMSLQDLKIQRVQSGSKQATQAYPGIHPERQVGPKFVGMPKSFTEASQSRQILDRISQQVSLGRFGTLPPSDFGTKLQGFQGSSFPARGIGGVYRKTNGQVVVVKPTIDDKTALAEVRATEIARKVHGLVSPKQSIRTMMDPTDPTGQRKFIVIESPYDPRIAAATGKFTKSDMIKQLVASTLRGDKDLQRANLSGNVLSDVGTAGVFDKASGFRDFAKAMPSMEQQAVVNLLGVKGGARKFFAQETSGIAARMTPAQYNAAIKTEINQSIPRLEKVIKSFDLNPDEQIIYGNMLNRLKAGAKTDWAALQPIHARAGDGVKKLELGNLEELRDLPESKKQVRRLRKETAKQAGREFRKLPKKEQQRVLDAIKTQQQNRPKDPRTRGGYLVQSNMLKFIEDEMVYDPKTNRYHDKKTLHFGKAGRTYQEVMDKVLYQMGIREENGALVGDKKLNTRSNLQAKMEIGGAAKASGTWKTSIPKDSLLYKVLLAEEKAFTEQNKVAGKNDPLKVVREKLAAIGYTPKQIDHELRTELSHISQTGKPGRGPAKWLSGTSMFDLRILNNFMNSKIGRGKVFDWSAQNGHPFIKDPKLVPKYAEAVEFMKRGVHPTTLGEAELVGLAADFDVKASKYNEDEIAAGRKPKGFPKLGSVRMAQGALALLDHRIGTKYYDTPQPIFELRSGTDKRLSPLARTVFVNPNGSETKMTIDPKTDTVIKQTRLTRSNTSAPPAGAVPSSKSPRDSAVTTLKPNQTVGTRRQFAAFRGRPAFSLPGMVKGDPRFDPKASQASKVYANTSVADMQKRLTRVQQIRFDRFKGKNPQLNESQLKDILRRRLKYEDNITKSKGREAAIARKTAKRAEALPKQQEAEQRKEKKQQAAAARKKEMDISQSKKNAPAVRKQEIKDKRMARQQRIGGISGGMAMGLGMAGSGLMMTGNMGAGMGLMGASVLAGLAPMFAGMGPFGLIVTAALAVGGGLFLLNKHLENAAKKQAEYIKSVSATTEKMEQISVITKRSSASQTMQRVREKGSFNEYNVVDRAGQQFGTTFVESDVGQIMVKGFVENMERFGAKQAAQTFGLELATYISDGILTSDQAASIAEQIGIQFGSRSYTTSIQGVVKGLVGPNGEDLINDALTVRTNIIQETNKRSVAELNALSQGGGRDSAARIAALSLNNIEIAKAQNDATEWQYRKQIQILQKQLTQTTVLEKQLELKTKISELEGKMAADTKVTSDLLTKQIQREVDVFAKNIQASPGVFGKNQGAYFTALKGGVQEKYKDTFPGLTKQIQKDLAKSSSGGSLTQIGRGFKDTSTAQQFEVFANLLMGQGFANPLQFKSFMDIYAGKEGILYRDLQVGLETHGPNKTIEMLDFFTEFKDKELVQRVVTDIVNKDPEQFDKIGKTLAQLAVLDGKEVNMEAYISLVGPEGLEKLANDLDVIQAMPDVTTKEAIIKYFEEGAGKKIEGISKSGLELLMSQWENWDALPDLVKKEAISKYLSIYETIFLDKESRKAYAQSEAEAMAKTDTPRAIERRVAEILDGPLNKARKKEAIKNTRSYFPDGVLKEDKLKRVNGGGGGGKKDNPLAFLDSLAMSIKQVRDNSFNALKPVESLLAAFRDSKTQKGAFALFDGIQNRLLKLGVGEGLRGAIESMSAEDFSSVAALTGDKALFTFKKGKPKTKNTITGLTKTGKAVDQKYKERDLGNFKLANDVAIAGVKEQTTAYNMLISSGLSASEALDVVADKSQAAAIASGEIKKGTPEWKKYIKSIKESNTALERQAVLNKIIRANEEFAMYKKMPELVSQMKALGYSTDQIDAVLGDPALAKELRKDLKDGKLDSEEIATFLNNIEEEKIIDIQTKLNKGDLAGAAEAGRQIVDDLFAAQENLIRTGPQALEIKANDIKIEDFEEDIQKITEKVNDLNRELEMNPFFGDRAIKAIQDENNRLSNDLTVISNAAEEVNKRYDEQAEALSKVEEINENILKQQEQQLDLADAITSGDISAAARAVQAIRASNAARFADAQKDALQQARENALGSLVNKGGLNEEQISKRQFENSQKIYAMETNEDRVKILKDIQDKQDAIYKIEKDISPLVNRNRELQKIIDTEIRNITVLKKTREEWERINAELDYFAVAQTAADNPDALSGLLGAADLLKCKWVEILAKMSEYTKGVPAEVVSKKETFLTTKTEAEKKAELDAPVAAKTAADEKFKQDAIKRSQGFNAPIGNIERSLAGLIKDPGISKSKVVSPKAQPYNPLNYLRLPMNSGGIVPKYMAMGGMVKVPYAEPAPVQKMNMGGLVPQYMALGGMALGTDTVPAMLTPGEYVLRKSAVERYGVDNLDAMNVGYYKDGGSVLGGISNFWKKIQSNPSGNQLSTIGIGLMKELGTVLQMAGNRIAPALIPAVSKDQGKSLAEFTQVPGIYRAVTGKSSEGPLGQDSLNAQRILDWSSVAGLLIPGAIAAKGAAKTGVASPVTSSVTKSPVTSSVTKSPGLVKKIVTLPKTRKAEVKEREANWARESAEAAEFLKNNPPPPRLSGPGAPKEKAWSSTWDDTIDDLLSDNSFLTTPEVIAPPQSAIKTIASNVLSTIAKPVTTPVEFVSRIAKTVADSWKYGENSAVRWGGNFDYFGRNMLMKEISSRSIGKLANKFNPKLTVKDKVNKLDPREPMINAFSRLQKYMSPLDRTGGMRSLEYKNIPKNILQNFVKTPISKAKLTFAELRTIANAGLSSANPMIRTVATGRKITDDQVQALVDSIPGGFGGLLQLLRGVHRASTPYEAAPLSIYERLAMSKTGEARTPANVYGPGNYFAASRQKSDTMFQAFGPYAYKTALTPSAILKVLLSKGLATREQVKKVAEKNNLEFAALETISHNADHPLMKALIDEGYLGYRHLDAFTNWMMGLMPGMGFKLVKAPKVPNISATTLPDGSIDLSKTSIPKVVIKRAEGGLVPRYFAAGGYAMGTDTVPAMLTPGEFVMSRYAVQKYGVENMKSINSGSSVGDSVYNYNLNLNVKSDANPDDIARAVMVQIKSVDAQRIRGARF